MTENEERTYTEDEYLDYGVLQYRRGKAQAEAVAASPSAAAPAAGLREADLDEVLSLLGPDALRQLQRHGFTVSRMNHPATPQPESAGLDVEFIEKIRRIIKRNSAGYRHVRREIAEALEEYEYARLQRSSGEDD